MSVGAANADIITFDVAATMTARSCLCGTIAVRAVS
jgi:hypothetical protein